MDRPAWVVWRLEPAPGRPGAWTKVPYRSTDPRRKASVTDPSTWSTFSAAFSAYEQHPDLSGIGLVLNGDGLAGLDLDYAIADDGKGKEWAKALLRMLPGAYVERSPGGKGIRAIFRATLPPSRRKAHHEDGAVELYDTARFLTITGQAIRRVDELPALDAEVSHLHQLVMPGDVGEGEHVETIGTGPAATVAPADLEILGVMLTSKRGAVLGRVWDSDYSDFGGDASSADLSLANALAFYCAKDPERVERIMRAGPWRPKWDEARGSTTWLGVTIGKAIGATRDVYRPSRPRESFDHAGGGRCRAVGLSDRTGN